MKRRLYLPLLIMALASLISGVLSLGQPVKVYAAVETLRPNAVGDYQEWTFADTTRYGATSDVDDATYVQAIGNATLYKEVQHLADPSFDSGFQINSVTYYFTAWSDPLNAGGGEKLDIIARLSTTDQTVVNKETVTRGSFNDYASAAQTSAPDGGGWTYQKITDLQAGIAVDTLGTGETVQVSEIWVVVDYTEPNIANTPNSWAFGAVDPSSEYTTGITYVASPPSGFRITNNVAYDVNITISATTMGSGWLLADGGSPDATHYALLAGTELTSGLYNITVTSGGAPLITVLASSTRDWGLKLFTPTTFSDGGLKSGTVTLTATQV